MSDSEKTDNKTSSVTQKTTQPFEGTHVDLGEDLLSNPSSNSTTETNEAVSDQSVEVSGKANSIEEELANVEILINEQIYDEGKKILRKILRKNPQHTRALELMENINQIEIQDLLRTGAAAGKRIEVNQEVQEDIHRVLDSLEQDLRIGVHRGELKPIPDLFANQEKQKQYTNQLLTLCKTLKPNEIKDLGVAHFEMGLYDIAADLFEEVVKEDAYKNSGTYLLGLSLIYANKSVEATIKIEPIIRDLTLPDDQKCDFYYLMGIAFEKLHETVKAREMFRKIIVLNPRYRDVVDKLR